MMRSARKKERSSLTHITIFLQDAISERSNKNLMLLRIKLFLENREKIGAYNSHMHTQMALCRRENFQIISFNYSIAPAICVLQPTPIWHLSPPPPLPEIAFNNFSPFLEINHFKTIYSLGHLPPRDHSTS